MAGWRATTSGPPCPTTTCVCAPPGCCRPSGTRLGADISIDKHALGRRPGGRQSDAASTLLALNRLWGLNLPRASGSPLGLKLGADVPFFIGGHNAFVEGIGERLTPLRAAAGFAVVKPPAARHQ